ncbi:MAG: glycosyltransferase [Myxococcales bacterium]|nr:glycosyltransferase [Myxococcales bacterium]
MSREDLGRSAATIQDPDTAPTQWEALVPAAQRYNDALEIWHDDGTMRLCAKGDPADVRATWSVKTRDKITVSMVTIVKDEAAHIQQIVARCKLLCDEVILGDTGSTDGTQEIARAAGATVLDIPWNDSFAEARNATLAHATGDLILWVDGDEIPEGKMIDDLAGWRALMEGLYLTGTGAKITLVDMRREGDATVRGAAYAQLRLFPRYLQPYYEARVHNRLHFRVLQDTPLPVHELSRRSLWLAHWGYDKDIYTAKNKRARFFQLMEKKREDLAREGRNLDGLDEFYLGREHCHADEWDKALPYLERAKAWFDTRCATQAAFRGSQQSCYTLLFRAIVGEYRDVRGGSCKFDPPEAASLPTWWSLVHAGYLRADAPQTATVEKIHKLYQSAQLHQVGMDAHQAPRLKTVAEIVYEYGRALGDLGVWAVAFSTLSQVLRDYDSGLVCELPHLKHEVALNRAFLASELARVYSVAAGPEASCPWQVGLRPADYVARMQESSRSHVTASIRAFLTVIQTHPNPLVVTTVQGLLQRVDPAVLIDEDAAEDLRQLQNGTAGRE